MSIKLLISDANILIDLEIGGIIENLFRLKFQIAVPDILFHDELASRHEYLMDLGLLILELNPGGVRYVVEFVQRYQSLRTSRSDLFAAALAKQEGCPLLTGDMDLRSVCKEQNIEVHGTIWLMEKLLSSNLVDVSKATEAYQRMREGGSRLPWKEVQEQLNRFKTL